MLRDIFARGEDVHAATAGQLFGVTPDQVDPGLRSKAKMFNFGVVYGLSAYGLADRLDIPQDEAQEFIDRYLGRFPKVNELIESTIEFAKENGYVKTLFGRMRRIPELRARQRQTRLLGERLAISTVIQGTAADIIKVAMVRSRRAVADAGLQARLVLQIHDELLFEAPEAEADQVGRDRLPGDDRRLRPGPAAGRRLRHRRQLAGGEVTPDPPDLRVSDADRERVAERLRDAAGEGRLTIDELDERVESAYAARTAAELAELTTDLPATATGREVAPSGRKPRRCSSR